MSSPQLSPSFLSESLRLLDAFIVAGTAYVCYAIYLVDNPEISPGFYATITIIGLVLQLNAFNLARVYQFERLSSLGGQIQRILLAWTMVFFILVTFAFLLKLSIEVSRVWAVLWFASTAVALVALRVAVKIQFNRWSSTGRLTRTIAVIGGGDIAHQMIAHLAKDQSVEVVGFFDDRTDRVPAEIQGVPKRGAVRDLLTFARLQRIDLVIIALPWSAEERLLEILRTVGILPVDIRLGPERVGYRFAHARYSHLSGAPLLNVLDRPFTDWQMLAKEAEDRVLALIFLMLVAPLMLTVAVAIRLTSRGPILFRQKRYGFNNQLIEVYKFRTMYADKSDTNADRLVSRNDPRVTPLGRWLRKTSLDELPQLINVLKGEMSIVGPRPHAIAAKAVDKLYDEVVQEYAARHRVKPGITGWAQVNGWRGETDTFEKIEKRVAYDLHYIENWSLYLDLKIILMTLPALLKSRNAY